MNDPDKENAENLRKVWSGPRWEYKMLMRTTKGDFVKMLKKFGAEGWEVIETNFCFRKNITTTFKAFLKRRIPE